MNKTKKLMLAAIGAASMIASGVASAAIDISTDTAAAKVDIVTAGGLIIGVCVAVAAVSWVRRVIR